MLRGTSAVVVVSIACHLAGCGGNPNGPTPISLTGTWTGTIRSSVVANAFANIALTLTQSGSSISGTFACTAGNMSCVSPSGTVSGTVSGSSVTGRVTFQGGSCQTFSGTVSGNSMSGSYSCSASLGSDSGTWSVTKQGSQAACTFSTSPSSASFSSTGGTGVISVSTAAGCNWSASSNVAWITITSGVGGTGSGVVNYSVGVNSAASTRTGSLAVAGQTITVTQSGATGIGTDNHADLGNPADEQFHNLRGWGSINPGPPFPPESGADRTSRYQLLRSSNSVDLVVPQAAIPYTLTFRTQDGGCDDSFDVYINDSGPVYRYGHRTSSDTFPVHRVQLSSTLITSRTVKVTFRNTATDGCGLAAVYYARLD